MRGRTAVLAIALAGSAAAWSQEPPCGLTSMTETVAPVYTAIARAAHVTATVILMVEFQRDGTAGNISVVSAPKMLEAAAVTYVRGWHANSYTGPRMCPIVVTYQLLPVGSVLEQIAKRQDLQHVTISGVQAAVYASEDPSSKIIHDWHWFYWKLTWRSRAHEERTAGILRFAQNDGRQQRRV